MLVDAIDFHCHIVPGADHGCKNSAVFQRQWEMIQDANISGVVATPHFYPHGDSVASFLKRRAQGVEKMKPHLSEASPLLYLGAEVLVCPNLQNLPDLERLCIEGTNCILLEMPFCAWTSADLESVRAIRDCGLIPLMAHVDRYVASDVLKLASLGVAMQVNATALASPFHRKNPYDFLKSGCVSAIGSDLHGTEGYRKFLKAARNSAVEAADVSAKSRILLSDATPLNL